MSENETSNPIIHPCEGCPFADGLSDISLDNAVITHNPAAGGAPVVTFMENVNVVGRQTKAVEVRPVPGTTEPVGDIQAAAVVVDALGRCASRQLGPIQEPKVRVAGMRFGQQSKCAGLAGPDAPPIFRVK